MCDGLLNANAKGRMICRDEMMEAVVLNGNAV